MASLDKFTGSWNKHLASHLLRRATYGVSYEMLNDMGSKSLDQCIDMIFQPLSPPPPPINLSYATDPDVPIGVTWVDKGTSANVNGYRNTSLRTWSLDLMLKGSPNIREKMTMFWHNHFVTADINDPRFSYIYIELLRSNALGNFKQLTKDIVIDVSMLNYLNGRENTKQAPNENFARELMELFTLGKGPLAGPGDYTTYTELDVKEVAKALTGWLDVRNLPIRSQFNLNRHDTTTKKLSHRFNNVSIPNAGADEYKNVINIIFEKQEVAQFLARKLYVWFVGAHIDETIEQEVIIPLANIIRDNNYDVAVPLKTLLSSNHFYDECNIGSIIKNPIDFLIYPLNQFTVAYPTDEVAKHNIISRAIYNTTNAMQMGMYNAPSVAGWQAYYQVPSYYRLWLNATSLPARMNYTDAIATTGILISGFRLQLNLVNLLNKFPDPSNADLVVEEFSNLLFCRSVSDNQMVVLKEFLILGSPSGWYNTYTTYKAEPTSETKLAPIVTRLRNLLKYMMRMPEYHLS